MNNFHTDEIKKIIDASNELYQHPALLSVIYSLGRDVQNEIEYDYAFQTLLDIYNKHLSGTSAAIILSFSLLAITHRLLNRQLVEPIIQYEWNHSNMKDKMIIQEAVDNINMFLGWNLNLT